METRDIIARIVYEVAEMEYHCPGREIAVCMTYDLFFKLLREVNDVCVFDVDTGHTVCGRPVEFLYGNDIRWTVGVRGIMPRSDGNRGAD